MKTNIASILFVLCVTFSLTAQPNRHQRPEHNFSIEQKTTLLLKKMTLSLELSDKQQQKMRPLVAEMVSNKEEMMTAVKANMGKRPELSSEEAYAKMIEKLDYQIAFQKKVKSILDDDQFEKYQETRERLDRAKKSHMRNAAHKRKGGPKGKGAHKGKGGQNGNNIPDEEA